MTAKELIRHLTVCDDLNVELEIYTMGHERIEISWVDPDGVVWVKRKFETP